MERKSESQSLLIGVSVLPQVFRAKIVSHNFLTMIGLLLVSVGCEPQLTKCMRFSKNSLTEILISLED